MFFVLMAAGFCLGDCKSKQKITNNQIYDKIIETIGKKTL